LQELDEIKYIQNNLYLIEYGAKDIEKMGKQEKEVQEG
jgi:hypothetical protein